MTGLHDQEGLIIVDSPSLARRTTIRLGGEAVAEARVSEPAAFERLPDLVSRMGVRCGVIGEGSNIIAADGVLPLLLLSVAPTQAPRVIEDRGGSALLRVSAGMRLPALLACAAGLGLTGLEGLCGIPGSVGGALAANAGSFGVEFGSFARTVRLFSPLWGVTERGAEDFIFSYRSCVLRGHSEWFLAHSVTLELSKGDRQAIRARMRETYMRKLRNQPVTARSAGCVFKNPAPEAPAGRLLDEAGLRGMRLGGMVFSPVHANFLVNEGGGTFEQAMELIEKARDRVRARSGFELELEVRIWQ
jgi:UDP-N-acetylmuramate dehydrogenase